MAHLSYRYKTEEWWREYDTIEQDETTATITINNTNTTTKNTNIQRIWTYDISITYDKYYQTPKVWILGYTSGGTPLETYVRICDAWIF